MVDSRIGLYDDKSIEIKYDDTTLIIPDKYRHSIDSFWQEKIRENKNIFNGPVIGLSKRVEKGNSITLIFQNTNYAHFMASQHNRIPWEYHSRSFYVSALIHTSDDFVAFGQMGQNSFDAGRYQYIGGGMERSFMFKGQSGYEQCLLCELEEELGLTGEHMTQIIPLYYSFGQIQGNFSLIFEIILNLTSAELVSQLAKHNAELVRKKMIPEVNKLFFVTGKNYETLLKGLIPAHLDENLYSSLSTYFSS